MASFFYSGDESSQVDTRSTLPHTPLRAARAAASLEVDELACSGPSTRRTQSSPPAQFASAPPLWRRWLSGFVAWLWDHDDSPRHRPAVSGWQAIQTEFVAAVWDLQSLRANQVRDKIEATRSLRELWHLRADVFKVISTHRGQIEAQLRLDALDSHFPVRASRPAAEAGASKVTTW